MKYQGKFSLSVASVKDTDKMCSTPDISSADGTNRVMGEFIDKGSVPPGFTSWISSPQDVNRRFYLLPIRIGDKFSFSLPCVQKIEGIVLFSKKRKENLKNGDTGLFWDLVIEGEIEGAYEALRFGNPIVNRIIIPLDGFVTTTNHENPIKYEEYILERLGKKEVSWLEDLERLNLRSTFQEREVLEAKEAQHQWLEIFEPAEGFSGEDLEDIENFSKKLKELKTPEEIQSYFEELNGGEGEHNTWKKAWVILFLEERESFFSGERLAKEFFDLRNLCFQYEKDIEKSENFFRAIQCLIATKN